MALLMNEKAVTRRLKFEYGMRVNHGRRARAELRALEVVDGRPLAPAIKRLARDYAGDVFGSPRYAPWLYVYAKSRGTFVEGWIPIDFFDHVVIRTVNRTLRRIGATKTVFRKLFGQHPAIPEVGYVIGGALYDQDYQPLSAQEAPDRIFAGIESVVIKDDGGGGGMQIRVAPTANLDGVELCRSHPNAVIQRRIRDHPRLRVGANANGARLRLTTCSVPGEASQLRAAFIAFPRSNQAYTKAGFNVVVGVDVASGTFGLRKGANQPSEAALSPELLAADTLAGVAIPGFEQASELVTGLHDGLPHLGVIGWDVMIDEAAQPWLIEWNTGMPGVMVTESLTGPNFLGLGWHALRWSADLDA